MIILCCCAVRDLGVRSDRTSGRETRRTFHSSDQQSDVRRTRRRTHPVYGAHLTGRLIELREDGDEAASVTEGATPTACIIVQTGIVARDIVVAVGCCGVVLAGRALARFERRRARGGAEDGDKNNDCPHKDSPYSHVTCSGHRCKATSARDGRKRARPAHLQVGRR